MEGVCRASFGAAVWEKECALQLFSSWTSGCEGTGSSLLDGRHCKVRKPWVESNSPTLFFWRPLYKISLPAPPVISVLVAELVDGEVADGSHLGRLLALAGLKAALKSDTIDQGCVVLVKALLYGANNADNAESADKDLLLRSQTEVNGWDNRTEQGRPEQVDPGSPNSGRLSQQAVLQLFQQSDAGEDVEQVLEWMFEELSTDSRVQARREELKMAWEVRATRLFPPPLRSMCPGPLTVDR